MTRQCRARKLLYGGQDEQTGGWRGPAKHLTWVEDVPRQLLVDKEVVMSGRQRALGSRQPQAARDVQFQRECRPDLESSSIPQGLSVVLRVKDQGKLCWWEEVQMADIK